MFNDIQSVRSLPISPSKLNYPPPPHRFQFQSPSESSRVRSPLRQQHWKQAVHPDISDKYNRLLRGEKVKWENHNTQDVDELKAYESTSKSGMSEVDRLKSDYEDKLKTLEQQNRNLRQELYYLREALLMNFQTKQEKDAK